MIDLFFSYWIFLWFFLYIFKFTSYNPKFAFIIALLCAIIYFFYLLFISTSIPNKTFIYKYIFEIFLNKIIPLLFLYHSKIFLKDIFFTSILFIIYLFYLFLKNTNILNSYLHLHYSIIHNQNILPFFKLYDSFFS